MTPRTGMDHHMAHHHNNSLWCHGRGTQHRKRGLRSLLRGGPAAHLLPIFCCMCRRWPSGARQATRSSLSTRTSNSCYRRPWTTPRRSYRHASPCQGSSTRRLAALRYVSSASLRRRLCPVTSFWNQI